VSSFHQQGCFENSPTVDGTGVTYLKFPYAKPLIFRGYSGPARLQFRETRPAGAASPDLNSPEEYQTGEGAGVLGEIEILDTSTNCLVAIRKKAFISWTLKVQ